MQRAAGNYKIGRRKPSITYSIEFFLRTAHLMAMTLIIEMNLNSGLLKFGYNVFDIVLSQGNVSLISQ